MKRSMILMLAGAMLLSCAGCAGAESTQPAANLTLPEQLTAEDLEKKGIEISYNANLRDAPGSVYGQFVDFRIGDEQDALQALAALSGLLGCKDFYDEIRFYRKNTEPDFTHYIFAQYYHDIPFSSHRIILHVKNETQTVISLSSGYIPDVEINTVPDISAKDAKKKAEDAVPNRDFPEAPEPVLMYLENEVHLVWLCQNDANGAAAWIDAHSGEVLYAFNGERPD